MTRVRDLLNVDREYSAVESAIRAYVETQYIGLSVDFVPILEIVELENCIIEYSAEKVAEICEDVDKKINEILYENRERIYLAERLERILDKHPKFGRVWVEDINDLKQNKQFLQYLDELVIRQVKDDNTQGLALA